MIGAILLGALLAVPAIGSATRSIPDVQQLYRSATRRVRHADKRLLAKAVLYEADGSAAGGHAVNTAQGITRWRFVFDNPTPKSPYSYATINYGPPPKAYGRISTYRTPYLEDYPITHAPRISLRRAVARLRMSGNKGRFDTVALRDPIAPPFAGALYIFDFIKAGNVRYVAVNARTGKVTKLG